MRVIGGQYEVPGLGGMSRVREHAQKGSISVGQGLPESRGDQQKRKRKHGVLGIKALISLQYKQDLYFRSTATVQQKPSNKLPPPPL